MIQINKLLYLLKKNIENSEVNYKSYFQLLASNALNKCTLRDLF